MARHVFQRHCFSRAALLGRRVLEDFVEFVGNLKCQRLAHIQPSANCSAINFTSISQRARKKKRRKATRGLKLDWRAAGQAQRLLRGAPHLVRELIDLFLIRIQLGFTTFLEEQTPLLSTTMNTFSQTERTTLRRLPQRAEYDREAVYRILDEGFICHVGFVVETRPFVIPTGYARVGDKLYIHGSQASRMLRTLSKGIDVCLTVTLVDGLVLARSAFHHSMNYRSVVVFGQASVVAEREEKLAALRALSEHMIPGRWDGVRGPNEQEMKATTVLSLPLEEASAKVRTGPPVDDEEDYELAVWAGVIPLCLVAGEPIADPRLPRDIEAPRYASEYKRR